MKQKQAAELPDPTSMKLQSCSATTFGRRLIKSDQGSALPFMMVRDSEFCFSHQSVANLGKSRGWCSTPRFRL